MAQPHAKIPETGSTLQLELCETRYNYPTLIYHYILLIIIIIITTIDILYYVTDNSYSRARIEKIEGKTNSFTIYIYIIMVRFSDVPDDEEK